jgi:hypothetical protein
VLPRVALLHLEQQQPQQLGLELELELVAGRGLRPVLARVAGLANQMVA